MYKAANELSFDELSDQLSPDQAAKMLGVSVGTLAAWRTNKSDNLPYIKAGNSQNGRVKYLRVHIEERLKLSVVF